jgi:hypothetical protein
MHLQEDLSQHLFSRGELMRLADYRAAVRSGFYSDGARQRRRLARSVSAIDPLLAEFEAPQRARLQALRDAVAGGLFGQDDCASE